MVLETTMLAVTPNSHLFYCFTFLIFHSSFLILRGAPWNWTTMSGISLRCIYPFCQSTICLLQLLTDILFPHHRTTLFQTIAESKGIEPFYRINDSPSLAGWHITTLSTLQLCGWRKIRTFNQRSNKPLLCRWAIHPLLARWDSNSQPPG